MSGVRVVTGLGDGRVPCDRCQATGCPWDRIGEKTICPDCQEQLALGEGPPLVERLRPLTCVVCRRTGSVPYCTFPLRSAQAVEIDLCPEHFRAFLGRRLERGNFRRLKRALKAVSLIPGQVFLLHEAFYDEKGRPLQPVDG